MYKANNYFYMNAAYSYVEIGKILTLPGLCSSNKAYGTQFRSVCLSKFSASSVVENDSAEINQFRQT